MTRWWEGRWFVLAALFATALPLLWPPVPPLTDLPGAIGRYHVMLGADHAILDRWYHFAWRPVGYVGGELLAAALAPLIGLEPAAKVIAIAIPLLTAWGILWLSREAHGRVQPLAIAALPLAYNFAVIWGFVNFTLAMALALNAFALWLRLGRQNRIVLRAMLFSVIAWAVWAAHVFGWIALGAMIFGAELAREREQRPWISALVHAGLACLPLGLPALMFLAWRPTDGKPHSDFLDSLPLKPSWLAMALRDRWQIFDVGSLGVLALLLYRAIRSSDFRAARPLAGAALMLLLLFLILPFGSAYIDARIAPYALILGLLAFAPTASLSARGLNTVALIAVALFGARTIATTASMAIESAKWQRDLVAIDQLPRGARVAALVINGCPPGWNLSRVNHLASMAIARKAAFTNDQFDLRGGTGLLEITADGLGDYAKDPSEITTAGPCEKANEALPLAVRLSQLPRDRFDYVWLIDLPAPPDPHLLAGLTTIWRNDTNLLLKIDRPGL